VRKKGGFPLHHRVGERARQHIDDNSRAIKSLEFRKERRMSVAATWSTREFQRIAAAHHRGDQLVVGFEDGSSVTLGAERVLPPETRGPNWEAMNVTPSEIIVPTAEGEVDIPWSTVRALTDKGYSAHLAAAAEDQARQIGLRIKQLRENRKLSGKDLAERAGITPQSLSRIEQGRHDVVFTTLLRILAAMGCSLKDIAAPVHKADSVTSILKRLADAGLDREFVVRRLLPPRLSNRLAREGAHENDESLIDEVASAVGRVFEWSVAEIRGGEPLKLNPAIAEASRFKVRGRLNELRATAHAVYAHFLSRLVVDATRHLPTHPVLEKGDLLRRAVLERYRTLDFAHLLRFAWDLGIPVIPLREPGAFHGASLLIEGRNVIVLKQGTDAHARWLNDLAHELKHVASHLSEARPAVVEGEEISVFSNEDSDDEWEANVFASELVFGSWAEGLAKQCYEAAEGSADKLKGACQQVAAREKVPVDALANYLAWRLSEEGLAWWGVANTFQVTEPSPWRMARDHLLERVEWSRLAPPDRELVTRAMAPGEDREPEF
jgi:transcriptional regulator with XRE-family HTH domain